MGKLTVGRELAALTGLPLFHNHLVVDAVLTVFPFHSPSAATLREQIWLMTFAEAARVDRSLIFTFNPERTIRDAFIAETVAAVAGHGGAVRFVALTCPETEQDRRVEAESRAAFGKLRSTAVLRQIRADGALDFGPIPAELTIDTTDLPPAQAARRIADGLGLPVLTAG